MTGDPDDPSPDRGRLSSEPDTGRRPRFTETPPVLSGLNPFGLVGKTVGRAVGSFHPKNVPALNRANFRRELAAAVFFPAAVAAVEGGVLGVVIKKYYEGVVSAQALDYAVAIATAAPTFANIVSFLFVRLAPARHKVRTVNALQLGVAAAVVAIALTPRVPAGLPVVLAAAVAARVCLAGVVTVRSAVWRANYGRRTRARFAARIAAVTTLSAAAGSLLIAALLNAAEALAATTGDTPRDGAPPLSVLANAIPDAARADAETWAIRLAYAALAALSLAGVFWWSRVRVRGHRALLRAERDASAAGDAPSVNPLRAFAVLRRDPDFAGFMALQFVIGVGNLMAMPIYVFLVVDTFALGYFDAVMVTQIIPTAVIPLFVGLWSALLDRVHIITFRAIHTWAFVVAGGLFFAAGLAGAAWLLPVAAAARGIAFSGGALAWNLGHNDFAKPADAPRYMGVHVTLTGVRGLVAPVVGVALYRVCERWIPGSGIAVIAVGTAVLAAGAIGFAAAALTERRPAADAA